MLVTKTRITSTIQDSFQKMRIKRSNFVLFFSGKPGSLSNSSAVASNIEKDELSRNIRYEIESRR